MKKNGVFLFVISHLVPEIFKIFVLCKLGTDDVIKTRNLSRLRRYSVWKSACVDVFWFGSHNQPTR